MLEDSALGMSEELAVQQAAAAAILGFLSALPPADLHRHSSLRPLYSPVAAGAVVLVP